jgi:dienelactone hydrolase
MIKTPFLALAVFWAAQYAEAAEPLPAELVPFFTQPEEFAGKLGPYRTPLKFYDGREVKSVEDWAMRRAEIRERWHGLMGKWPRLLAAPKLEEVNAVEREGFIELEVKLEVAPGYLVEAYLLVPDGKGPFPAVVVPYYDAKTGAGHGKELRDFGAQLTRRGFVSLSLGWPMPRREGGTAEEATIQPLTFLAYVAANCHRALERRPEVEAERIGIVGHSFGGKWAMFASCLYDKFACAAWSDGGIVFDEKRGNVNYWEPWYLGYDPELEEQREKGIPNEQKPRTGAYARMMAEGIDLHELHALMAPRPFLVSGGAEDRPERWVALNHAVAVNRFLGFEKRVGMTNRLNHSPTEESNAQIYQFFEHFLGAAADRAERR